MRGILLVLFCFAGCETRTETVQQWQGQVGDQPISVQMRSMSKEQAGPDIQALVSAGIEAAKGDIIGATTALIENQNTGFESRMAAMDADLAASSAYGAGDMARDGGIAAVLMPLLLQFLRQRKQDKRMDELDRERVELAKRIPTE